MASETTYEIEKLVEFRTAPDGTVEWCVQWLHYDASKRTWEPEANLPAVCVFEYFLQLLVYRHEGHPVPVPTSRNLRARIAAIASAHAPPITTVDHTVVGTGSSGSAGGIRSNASVNPNTPVENDGSVDPMHD
jgi:hypothetical protein